MTNAVGNSPAIGHSPIRLLADKKLRDHVIQAAAGRPLVIDFYTSRGCGVTVGDITARLTSGPMRADYVELEPIENVRVIAERRLVPLLPGASLHLSGLPFGRGVRVELSRSEDWLDFLEHHPTRLLRDSRKQATRGDFPAAGQSHAAVTGCGVVRAR